MRRITVEKVSIKPGSPYSSGVGFDDNGVVVDFVGDTTTMANIAMSIEDYEDQPEIGKPTIFLMSWQII